jgi:hypothetical protein
MEASLVAAAETGVALNEPLFESFFAVVPERKASFLVAEAAAARMTDKTLHIILGACQQ